MILPISGTHPHPQRPGTRNVATKAVRTPEAVRRRARVHGHDDGGELQPLRPALLPRPGRPHPQRRRQGAGADRLRPRGGRVRVGAAVGRARTSAGCRCAPGIAAEEHLDPGRGATAAPPGRGPRVVQAADPRARAADEGRRRRLPRRRTNVVHGLLHRAAPGRLPRAGPRPGPQPAGPGRAAPARPARRGARCRAASARAAATCAAPRSSRTSSRSACGWPRTRTCR